MWKPLFYQDWWGTIMWVLEEWVLPFSPEVPATSKNGQWYHMFEGKIFIQESRDLGAFNFFPSFEWLSDLNSI